VNAQAPETTSQDSRGPRASRAGSAGLDLLEIALALAAFGGAVLLVVSDFTTLFHIKVITVVRESKAGHSNHAFAMVLLGLLALPMAYGATRFRSRPAMTALVVIGAAAALVVLAVDLPDVNKTGVIGATYSDAAASPQIGFYLESLGAALLIVGGGASLLLTAPERTPRQTGTPPPQTPEERQRERDEAERAAAAAARAEARARRERG
jgi:hypothetical protein